MDGNSGQQWQSNPKLANLIRRTVEKNIAAAITLLKTQQTDELLQHTPEIATPVFEEGMLQVHPLVAAARQYDNKEITTTEVAAIFQSFQPLISKAVTQASNITAPGEFQSRALAEITDIAVALNSFIAAADRLKALDGTPSIPDAVKRKPDMKLGGTDIWFQ